MPTSINCPGCNKSFKVSDKMIGKRVKCPQCDAVVSVPEPFSSVDSPSPDPSSLKSRGSTKSVAHLLGSGGSLVIVAVLVVSLAGGCFFKSKSERHAENQSTASTISSTIDPAPNTGPEVKDGELKKEAASTNKQHKDEAQENEKEKERVRLEEEMKKLQDAIQNAEVLQAPSLGKGQLSKIEPFAKDMWELANNEFKVRNSRNKIYQTTFDQKDQVSTKNNSLFTARNSILRPGKYDFDTRDFFLDPVLWHEYYGKTTGINGLLPEITDSCVLLIQIKVDANIAEQWREKMDKKVFGLKVWYRFKEAKRVSRMENPHWTNGKVAYDIALLVDVVKFEEVFNEVKNQPKAKDSNPDPKTSTTPRKVADEYVKSVEKKGLLRRVVFAGTYKSSKKEDSYAVSYTVSEVNRKPVTNQLVHVLVIKDKDGEWRISAFSADGVHVALGPPPRGFIKVIDPKPAK